MSVVVSAYAAAGGGRWITSLLRMLKVVTGGICMLESNLRLEEREGTHCICSASVGLLDCAPAVGHAKHTPPTEP
jgi:hypothetical protein